LLLITAVGLLKEECLRRLQGEGVRVFIRSRELPLEKYFSEVLDWISGEKAGKDPGAVVILDEGYPLNEAAPKDGYLLTDVMGLMLQPICRTEDESGNVQFTDVSRLFDEELKDRAENVFRQAQLDIQAGVAAGIAAPRLLSAAERGALQVMGTDVALAHLYLDARAARARAVPALGVAIPVGSRPALGEALLKIFS